jgi:hypothetical protein
MGTVSIVTVPNAQAHNKTATENVARTRLAFISAPLLGSPLRQLPMPAQTRHRLSTYYSLAG